LYLGILAMALLKLPSPKKAQDVIHEIESKYLLVANRYANLFFTKTYVALTN